MKQLSKKAIVVPSILALVIVPSITIAALNSTKPEPIAKPVPAVVAQPEETPQVVEPVVDAEPVVRAEPVAEVTAPVEVAPVEAPAVLSIQEYGEKYLDLKKYPESQGCFDNIVNTWPDRFVESVREDNTKALRFWGMNVCWSGMHNDPNINRYPSMSATIRMFGVNGGYFDSPLAKQTRNR